MTMMIIITSYWYYFLIGFVLPIWHTSTFVSGTFVFNTPVQRITTTTTTTTSTTFSFSPLYYKQRNDDIINNNNNNDKNGKLYEIVTRRDKYGLIYLKVPLSPEQVKNGGIRKGAVITDSSAKVSNAIAKGTMPVVYTMGNTTTTTTTATAAATPANNDLINDYKKQPEKWAFPLSTIDKTKSIMNTEIMVATKNDNHNNNPPKEQQQQQESTTMPMTDIDNQEQSKQAPWKYQRKSTINSKIKLPSFLTKNTTNNDNETNQQSISDNYMNQDNNTTTNKQEEEEEDKQKERGLVVMHLPRQESPQPPTNRFGMLKEFIRNRTPKHRSLTSSSSITKPPFFFLQVDPENNNENQNYHA